MSRATAPLSQKISRRRALLIARNVTLAQRRLAQTLEPRIRAFLIAQVLREARRLKQIPASEEQALEILVRPFASRAVAVASEQLGALAGAEIPVAAETQAILSPHRQRLANVTQRTRRQIERIIVEGSAEGLSSAQVADRIRAAAPKIGARAGTIARTEMALVSQEAAFNRYRSVGVQFVDILDGGDCGWTDHDDGDGADGSRRTLQAAEAQPLSHPNCVRVSVPVVP